MRRPRSQVENDKAEMRAHRGPSRSAVLQEPGTRNGFAVLHFVSAVPVHALAPIGPCLRTSVTGRDRRGPKKGEEA